MVRDIGVACGQGYHIARPHPTPTQGDSGGGGKGAGAHHQRNAPGLGFSKPRHRKILKETPSIPSTMLNNQVDDIFCRTRNCNDTGGRSRHTGRHHQSLSHDRRFARPFQREFQGKSLQGVYG
jgi:hypothetical protein